MTTSRSRGRSMKEVLSSLLHSKAGLGQKAARTKSSTPAPVKAKAKAKAKSARRR